MNSLSAIFPVSAAESPILYKPPSALRKEAEVAPAFLA
jgi:hypothetical protein